MRAFFGQGLFWPSGNKTAFLCNRLAFSGHFLCSVVTLEMLKKHKKYKKNKSKNMQKKKRRKKEKKRSFFFLSDFLFPFFFSLMRREKSFCYLRRLVIHRSSRFHLVSESGGVSYPVTDGVTDGRWTNKQKYLCLILDLISFTYTKYCVSLTDNCAIDKSFMQQAFFSAIPS